MAVSSRTAHVTLPADDQILITREFDAPKPTQQTKLEVLRRMSSAARDHAAIGIHFMFGARPLEVLGESRTRALRCERMVRGEGGYAPSGIIFDLPAELIVSCIGYRSAPFGGMPHDPATGRLVHRDGHIIENVWCTGWARRGPNGTIGSNRLDAAQIAQRVIATTTPSNRAGRAGLVHILEKAGLSHVPWSGWKSIEADEIARAPAGAPRRKFRSLDEQFAAAGLVTMSN